MRQCPQCERPLTVSASACPDCGVTLIRNIADTSGLRRALMAVGRPITDTPPPTELLDGLQPKHFFLHAPPASQDTDSHHRPPGEDTSVEQPQPAKPVKPERPQPKIPGYILEEVLGRGGMGTVYLARQLSLDRPVAIKIMSRRWTGDPTFVARFTREAYAAARMTHPNLVQVYDIGEVDQTRYFSMEYVDGRTLAEIIRRSGKLDPEIAVGYILQAARGLKYAHERGMIHRDVKPDNLLVDAQGIVKVADLGLVKTSDQRVDHDRLVDDNQSSDLHTLPVHMTGVRMALGTPAYMSPEQCRDATAVDHRADIYSLGCTLYSLVTGRQPFDGESAVDLMKKHAYQPVVPPEVINNRISRELSAIIQKMMAKSCGDRYQTMAEVIATLEQWLGVPQTSGRMIAGDDQIAALEALVDQFTHAPAMMRRTRILTIALSACVLGMVLLTFIGRLGWSFGLGGMILQAAVVYFLINGIANKTYLFQKAHSVGRGLSSSDALIAIAMIGLFGVLLWTLHLFWIWVGFGLIGAALAGAVYLGLDGMARQQRQGPLQACEQLLRRLRVQGLDEMQLRYFVAKYAGRHWEEFFEQLFGFEAKLDARAKLLRGESAGERDRHASWREPIIALLSRFERSQKAAVERGLMIRTEQARLMATGLPASTARLQAVAAVQTIGSPSPSLRSSETRHRLENSTPGRSGSPLPLSSIILPSIPERPDPLHRLTGHLIGPWVRGTLALFCIAACIGWAIQNNILWTVAVETKPLTIEGIPEHLTSWIDTPNIGWAGALLAISLMYHGQRMAGLVLIGAAITAAAHRFGIPAVEPVRDSHVGLLLGTVIALLGYRMGRR